MKVSEVLWCRNILCITGGIIFFRRKFWASQCWKFLWASLQNFRNFGVLKIFLHNRGYHVFPSKSFCLTVPNYFIGEHCGVSEKFFYRKFQCIGGVGHRDFAEIFCLTGPKRKSLWKKPSVFQKVSGIEKKLWIRGAYHDFQSKFLCLLVQKHSYGNPTVFEKFFGFEKFCGWKGGYHVFRRKIWVSQCRKFSWASLESFRSFVVSKHFMHNSGYHIFPSEFWVSQCWKFWWASHQYFKNFGVSKIFIRNRGYHVFPSKNFCLTVPKKVIWELFVVSEKIFQQKFSCIGRGRASRYCQTFLFHRTEMKFFVRETFCFPENLWYRKKFMDKRGQITIFSQIFHVSQCRKIS